MTPRRRLKLLAGRGNPELSNRISRLLKIPLTEVELNDFADGEIKVRIKESVRGCDVFIIQSHESPVNKQIIEQALLIDAAKRAGAASVTAVCPYLGYARQDRVSLAGEPVGAKLVLEILIAAGVDRIIAADIHSEKISGLLKVPVENLPTNPIFLSWIRQIKSENKVIVAPDLGSLKTARLYSEELGCELAVIDKVRHGQKVLSRFKSGKVAGKVCIVVDDIVDTASTLISAGELLKKSGAKELYAIASHGVFSGSAIKRLEASTFKKIAVTDSLMQAKSSRIQVLSVAPLIAEAIKSASSII